MKPLTKLLTATTLTIVLFSNAAHANDKICDINSKFIAGTFKSVKMIADTSLFDKSSAIELLRPQINTHDNTINIMAHHALDYVNDNYEKMKLMSNVEIKQIGYTNCGHVKKKIR